MRLNNPSDETALDQSHFYVNMSSEFLKKKTRVESLSQSNVITPDILLNVSYQQIRKIKLSLSQYPTEEVSWLSNKDDDILSLENKICQQSYPGVLVEYYKQAPHLPFC